MSKLRMAQYGVGHGHASGKARAMAASPDVEFLGVYEADDAARERARSSGVYGDARWYASPEEMLGDSSVDAIAIEGRNDESLAQAHRAIDAGKHLWYDKPAGDDWAGYVSLIEKVRRSGKHLQMGYMLRYHDAFRTVSDMARGGQLGDVFHVRVNMSTYVPATNPSNLNNRSLIARHRGGILFDLGGHVLDQVVWITGRPRRVTAFLHNDGTPDLPQFADNTIAVLEFERALASIEISCLPVSAGARRLEVHGTGGSAIVVEQFEQAGKVKLLTREGEQELSVGHPSRQEQYERELTAFVATVRGQQPPDRPLEHEILVQETLMRATGGIPGG
jgi:predicted dehydrogenase